MSSRNATIGKAVVDALNLAASRGTFRSAFVAERHWAPITSLDQISSDLTVPVYCAGDDRARDTRAHDKYTSTIDVGVIRRLSPAAKPLSKDPSARAIFLAEVDGHVELAEQICAFFKPGVITIDGGEFKSATLLSPLLDGQVLLNDRLMVTIVSVQFQLFVRNP